MLPKNLSKEEKKTLMLKKYVKRDAMDVDDIKKFGVFWRPTGSDVFTWNLICKTETEQEALNEIRWRYQYHKTNDGDLVLDNDKRFKTFRDETLNKDKNGNIIEPDDIKVDKDGNVISMGDMVDIEKMGDTFMESLPKNPTGKFKTAGFYAGIELDFKGEFTILPVYEIE